MEQQHPYLTVGKTVTIQAVNAGSKWNGLITNPKEKGNEPFLFKKAVKSFQVPLSSSGMGVVQILDSIKLNECYDLLDSDGNAKKLTEKQYFEYTLGIQNLSHLLPKETNFWCTDSRAKLFIKSGQQVLNLSNASDVLLYKIALANKKYICPSQAAYKKAKLASYMFVITTKEETVNSQVHELELEEQIYDNLRKINTSDIKMREFLAVKNINASAQLDTKELKVMVTKEAKREPKEFIKLLSDQDSYRFKVFLTNAIKLGQLKIVNGNYTLPIGTVIGKYVEIKRYFSNPANKDLLDSIKIEIEQANNSLNVTDS